jgi:phosphoserine phosphatase
MTNILVLITDPVRAGLNDSIIAAVRDALAAAGVAPEQPRGLADGIAAEIAFGGDAAAAKAAAKAALAAQAVDVAVVPAHNRRKRLLIADMESTLIENEFLDDIGARAGLGEKIAGITKRAMAGELDFAGALRERVVLLKGLPATLLDEVYAGLRIMPGARTLVATMRKHGAAVAIVSGGFRIFVDRVRAELGADVAEANDLEVAGGVLSGRVREPIFDRASKAATLQRLVQARGWTADDALAVGDGANDLDMVRAAGLGVAFRAKPVLADAAAVAIKHGDLTALLYLQGYRKDEFSA